MVKKMPKNECNWILIISQYILIFQRNFTF